MPWRSLDLTPCESPGYLVDREQAAWVLPFLDRAGRPGRSEMESSGALRDWYANVWFWPPTSRSSS